MISYEVPLYQLTNNVSIVKVEHNLQASSADVVTVATGRKRN
jgi:hypothetical protein